MKTLEKRFTSLAFPAVALVALVSIGVIESRLSTALYCTLVITVLIALLLWQISIRYTFAAATHAVVLEDQISAVRPYGTAYAAIYLGMLAAIVGAWYFELNSTFFIAGIAAWFLRKDIWAAMILCGLDRTEVRSAPRPP